MRILVLEDNHRIVEIYKKIFLQKGYEADFVSDAVSCLDRLVENQQKYDYVILEKPLRTGQDCNLEDAIRAADPHQRVFFLSPYMSMQKPGYESLKDTTDLIDKPFAMISLLSYVEIKNPIPHTL